MSSSFSLYQDPRLQVFRLSKIFPTVSRRIRTGLGASGTVTTKERFERISFYGAFTQAEAEREVDKITASFFWHEQLYVSISFVYGFWISWRLRKTRNISIIHPNLHSPNPSSIPKPSSTNPHRLKSKIRGTLTLPATLKLRLLKLASTSSGSPWPLPCRPPLLLRLRRFGLGLAQLRVFRPASVLYLWIGVAHRWCGADEPGGVIPRRCYSWWWWVVDKSVDERRFRCETRWRRGGTHRAGLCVPRASGRGKCRRKLEGVGFGVVVRKGGWISMDAYTASKGWSGLAAAGGGITVGMVSKGGL